MELQLCIMKINRNRNTYFFFLLITITLGLFSRASFIPKLIYPYLGDFLYTIMVFILVGIFSQKSSSSTNAITAVLICYSIELLQLYQGKWIMEIRSYPIGRLILGEGFLWSDIVTYSLAGVTCYFLEKRFKS